MITDYLVSLHGELRMPRRRRARVLAEVEDHLLCAVSELRSRGVALEQAEERAVEAFGDPAELAGALSAVEARRHTIRAGWLAAPLALAAAWLGFRGVVGSGAPLPFAIVGFALAQVALIAGGLTAFRAWLARRSGGPALLVLVRRGSVLVAGCLLVVGVSAAVTVAAHGASLTGAAVALVGGSAALLVACGRALRRGGLSAGGIDPDHDVLAELEPLVGGEVVRRVERWISLRRRPWRFAAAVSCGAGLALATGHGVAEGGPAGLAHVPAWLVAGAILAGVEMTLSLAGFLMLGRWLGLRAAAD